MLKRQLFLLPIAILMLQGSRLVAACGGASRATRVLHKKVGKIQLHYDSARGVLYSLAETANVVIGVEEVESPSKSVFFDFPGGTVRQLLDSFVSQFPAYQWREDKGIIHVFWHGTHLPIADVAISYPGAHGKTLGQMRSDIPD